MLELFPDTATVEDGELGLGSVGASELAEEFGTPLVVYCERTLRGCADAYRRSAPQALLAYCVKTFPNVALLELFSAAGVGADVSTLGSSPSRFAPGSRASASSCTGTTRATRSCAPPPRPARSTSSWTRSTRSGAPRRRRSGACSCA